MSWRNAGKYSSVNYVCGYCGSDITSELGYQDEHPHHGDIRICHKCGKPSYIEIEGRVTPGSAYGKKIMHLPKNIEDIYDEARRCFSVNAFNSVIMCCRKLLMHIACENGADEGLSFGKYVQYLKDNGYVAKPTFKLADAILKYGNIANHQLETYENGDAVNIMLFTEVILKNIYELPEVYEGISAVGKKATEK